MISFAACHPELKNAGKGLCQKCYRKNWYKNNKDSSYVASRKWIKANPEKSRHYRLKHRYGISLTEFNFLASEQNWLCKICLHKPKKLVVDHNHKTGNFRGLVCQSCNFYLGKLDAKPEILLRLKLYIEEDSNAHSSTKI